MNVEQRIAHRWAVVDGEGNIISQLYKTQAEIMAVRSLLTPKNSSLRRQIKCIALVVLDIDEQADEVAA